jgi:hypothetical protein
MLDRQIKVIPILGMIFLFKKTDKISDFIYPKAQKNDWNKTS